MMALVLVWVVETGMPSTVMDSSRHSALDRSAEKPWYFSSRTMSMPTDLMMRFTAHGLVPTPMTVLHRIISQMGMITPVTLRLPVAERHAEEQHADEFLAVLGAVHEAHGRGADDLRVP